MKSVFQCLFFSTIMLISSAIMADTNGAANPPTNTSGHLSGNCNMQKDGSKLCVFTYNQSSIQYTVPADSPLVKGDITLYVSTVGKDGNNEPTCDANSALMKTTLTFDQKNTAFTSDSKESDTVKKIFSPNYPWCAGAIVSGDVAGKPVTCEFWHWGDSFRQNQLHQRCTELKVDSTGTSCGFAPITCPNSSP